MIYVLKPGAELFLFPDVSCKKKPTQIINMEITIVFNREFTYKSKTDTDGNTEKGKRSTYCRVLIFSHTTKIAGMSRSWRWQFAGFQNVLRDSPDRAPSANLDWHKDKMFLIQNYTTTCISLYITVHKAFIMRFSQGGLKCLHQWIKICF